MALSGRKRDGEELNEGDVLETSDGGSEDIVGESEDCLTREVGADKITGTKRATRETGASQHLRH